MSSIYIHIPFCEHKCKYCSFQVIPTEGIKDIDTMISSYIDSLLNEISYYADSITSSLGGNKLDINSIYIGGGTPNRIGSQNLLKILEHLEKKFNIENLGELTIEVNPYPEEEVLGIIQTIQKKYHYLPRIRWSVGLQTFDTQILQDSGRLYSFPAIVDFLRKLQKEKKANTVFNFDFIAFGKFNQTKKGNLKLWDDARLSFFEQFVNSLFADSFSLYILELFSGSQRYSDMDNPKPNMPINKYYGSDEDVFEEFNILKDIILNAGYKRYEISSFALPSKGSMHNMVYREMGNYISFGTSASSFIDLNTSLGKAMLPILEETFPDISKSTKAVRRTNTLLLADYLKGNYIDHPKDALLNQDECLSEKLFLGLRTHKGIDNIHRFETILEADYMNKLKDFQSQGLIDMEEHENQLFVTLTDQGMDLYNEIITELIAHF